MILKVKVNLPEDSEELINKATTVVADILIKKLQPKEIDRLIDLLNDESLNIGL